MTGLVFLCVYVNAWFVGVMVWRWTGDQQPRLRFHVHPWASCLHI